jgi:hypothetical protein
MGSKVNDKDHFWKLAPPSKPKKPKPAPPVTKPKTDRLNGMKGVQEWSKKRTTNEPIPSTVSKEAADIIRKIQARNKARNKG